MTLNHNHNYYSRVEEKRCLLEDIRDLKGRKRKDLDKLLIVFEAKRRSLFGSRHVGQSNRVNGVPIIEKEIEQEVNNNGRLDDTYNNSDIHSNNDGIGRISETQDNEDSRRSKEENEARDIENGRDTQGNIQWGDQEEKQEIKQERDEAILSIKKLMFFIYLNSIEYLSLAL